MSQLNTLLESANPYKSLQSDAARLASKWSKTGLLEGLSEVDSNNMSLLLENQAKQLVTETSTTGGGTSAGTFTPGTGAQYATPYAFGKAPVSTYTKMGYKPVNRKALRRKSKGFDYIDLYKD